MAVLDQTTDLALSAAMREGSMAEHQAAEDSSFMSELLGGRVNERGYADYLLRLRVVYATMEETVGAHRDDAAVSAVADTALERLAAIDADLDHWVSDGERSVVSPAAAAYRQRLLDAAAEWPTLLVAHHYTRYLGDLSGGQAISRLVARHYAATDEQLAFYRFDGIDNHVQFKRDYRVQLDALPLSDEQSAAVVAEALAAFEFNGALFDELHHATAAA